jgi:hypothetical protein
MADHPDDLQTDLRDLDVVVDPAGLADWIDAEPVRALRHYREELVALAEDGLDATGPVADRLVDVISALQDAGETLRDDDALPSSLAAVLEQCAADLDGARSLVVRTRDGLQDPGTPVSEATRERVRAARAATRDHARPGPR